MAIVTYPLNNIDYTAEDAEIYNSTRTSGVFAVNAYNFSVTGTDSFITIEPGMAWIKNSAFSGKAIAHKENTVLELPVSDAFFPRIDVIALQFDKALNVTNLVVKPGEPASSPVIPAIVQTEMLYELYLYAVRREAGAIAVAQGDVTDLRPDEKYCGLMRDGVTRDTALPDGSVTTEKFAPNAKAPFAGTADYAEKTGATYTATIPASGWSSSAPYTVSVAVSGLLSTDNPVVDVVPSDTADTAKAQLEAWANVGRIVTADSSITVYCYDAVPTTAIPIQLKVVR